MNIRVRFEAGIFKVFKGNVEIPDVEVSFSKEMGRAPTSVKLVKKGLNPGQADVSFIATEWQFVTKVPPDMETLVDNFLSA